MIRRDMDKKVMYYLGIDGGGTKTVFLFADENGNILKEVVKGASNPIDLGVEKCLLVLKEGIYEAIDNVPFENISVFAGISGGSTGDNKRLIGRFLQSFNFARCDNGSDAENIVKTGLDRKNGIVVITGTGCCAFAKNGDKLRRFGGLGWLFDHYGGGYDYGNYAIRAALMAEDGTGEKTLLRDLILQKTGPNTVMEDLACFNEIKKKGIAEFAPIVFEAYRKGDGVAKAIIIKTAEYLANLISAAAKFSGKTSGKYKTVFVGGLTRVFGDIEPFLIESLSKTENANEYNISVYDKNVACGALYLAGMKTDKELK